MMAGQKRVRLTDAAIARLPLSANITETPATLGISVGRWR